MGVNHLGIPLRQLHATHRASSCAKRGGHVQLCSKPRGARVTIYGASGLTPTVLQGRHWTQITQDVTFADFFRVGANKVTLPCECAINVYLNVYCRHPTHETSGVNLLDGGINPWLSMQGMPQWDSIACPGAKISQHQQLFPFELCLQVAEILLPTHDMSQGVSH